MSRRALADLAAWARESAVAPAAKCAGIAATARAMSPRRSAFIDIGTNTILCLIAEIRDTGRFRVLDDLAEIAGLGKGVDQTGSICAEGEQRALAVLERYLEHCKNLGVEEIIAVGTSALRDARNSAEVRARYRAKLGLEIRVISGDEEAAYSFLAVERGLALAGRELLVIDVGGGSTEFIRGNAAGVLARCEHRCRFGAADGALCCIPTRCNRLKSNGCMRPSTTRWMDYKRAAFERKDRSRWSASPELLRR